MWAIDPGPPNRRKESWVRVQAAAEAREKKATRRKGLWVRDRGRAAGRGPGAQRTLGKGCRKVRWRRKEARPRGKTGAHRRGLWVAAPHPVRPLSHTHPPRGALLGLATVRGLAAAPQQ